MIKKLNINDFHVNEFQPLLPHNDLFFHWAVATKDNHDIEFMHEDAPGNLTQVTAIYKNRGDNRDDIVGESTYEPRIEGGFKSEYAFYADYQWDKYRRPLKMWPSGRPLVANEFNNPAFRYNQKGYPTTYRFYDRTSKKSEVPYDYLLIHWFKTEVANRYSED